MTRRLIWLLLVVLLGLSPRAWAQGGQLAQNGDSAQANLANPAGGRYASATVTLSGTWSGTASFFHSEDNGLTWNILNVIRESDGARVTTATADGSFDVANPGYGLIEVVASGWASGSAAVRITGGAGAVNIPVFAGSVSASISAPANNPIFVQPSDGTNAQTFHQADADTGVGTANRIFVGLFAPGSGGPQLIPGDATNGLKVQCTTGCSGGGGSGTTDEAAFTAASSTFGPAGGFFQTTATNNPLTSGQQGMWQMTANRAGFVNLRTSAGAELAVGGNPLRIDPTGTTTQPVSGTVTSNAGTGTFTVGQATGTNLHMVCDSGCSGSGGTSSSFGSAFPSTGTAIGFKDSTGTNMAAGNLDASGNLKVNIASVTSPDTQLTYNSAPTLTGATGGITFGFASTAAPTAVTSGTPTLPWLDLNGRVHVTGDASGTAIKTDPSGVTSPISAASLPLPTGAATSANQSTANTTLAALQTDLEADACSSSPKTKAVINLTASGQIITGTSAKKTYICSLNLVTATAQNIALVEGTGTTCATGIAGMAGGTTAATGWNFAANGGLAVGDGKGSVFQADNATADNVCLLLSGTGQTSGVMMYVQK